MEQKLGEAALPSISCSRPHILAIPVPLFGHITPMVQLSKALVAVGCRVTLVSTERNTSFLSKLLVGGSHHHLIRVLTISDGLPVDLEFSWDGWRALVLSFNDKLPLAFAPHLQELLRTDPIACVLSDAWLSWTQDAANDLGVPRLALWISSAAECQIYLHSQQLISSRKLPFRVPHDRASPNDVDNMVPSFPGRPPMYHRAIGEGDEKISIIGLPNLDRTEFPTFLQIEDSSDPFFYFWVDHINNARVADMLLFNSFEGLEKLVFNSMRSEGIIAHPIGPLLFLEDEVMKGNTPFQKNNYDDKIVNQLQEGEKYEKKKEGVLVENDVIDMESKCLQWLDAQQPKSVIYVAFGSMLYISNSQVKELALGLETSGQPFIWALKGHSKNEETNEGLPRGFIERVEQRGLVMDWAPQSLILKHPSTGGFLSHCGWNSSLEALCMGVPILGCPFVSDQPLICKFLVEEWKVALRLEKTLDEGIVLAKDVAMLTRELLVGDIGKVLRKRAQEWSELAKSSIQHGGSSYVTLEYIMNMLKTHN